MRRPSRRSRKQFYRLTLTTGLRSQIPTPLREASSPRPPFDFFSGQVWRRDGLRTGLRSQVPIKRRDAFERRPPVDWLDGRVSRRGAKAPPVAVDRVESEVTRWGRAPRPHPSVLTGGVIRRDGQRTGLRSRRPTFGRFVHPVEPLFVLDGRVIRRDGLRTGEEGFDPLLSVIRRIDLEGRFALDVNLEGRFHLTIDLEGRLDDPDPFE